MSTARYFITHDSDFCPLTKTIYHQSSGALLPDIRPEVWPQGQNVNMSICQYVFCSSVSDPLEFDIYKMVRGFGETGAAHSAVALYGIEALIAVFIFADLHTHLKNLDKLKVFHDSRLKFTEHITVIIKKRTAQAKKLLISKNNF